jgi:hypothetical protein
LVAAGLLSACQTFNEPVSTDVRNDLSRGVTLAVCGSKDCSKRLDPWRLRPGHSGAVNVEPKFGDNSAILLDSVTGVVLGCLPFKLSHRPQGAFGLRASQALPCGDDGGATAARGQDWPDENL